MEEHKDQPAPSGTEGEQKQPVRKRSDRESRRKAWRSFREHVRITFRRAGHLCHDAVAGHQLAAPVSFLAVSAALGLALTLTTLYTPSYAVIVDGENLGVVTDQSTVQSVVDTVERRGSALLGYDYTVDNAIDYEFALTLRTDLTDETVFENYFFQQLEETGNDLRKYEVLLDGQVLGVIDSPAEVDAVLDELRLAYVNEDTVDSGFVETVTTRTVYQSEDLLDADALRAILIENTTGDTTYTVVAGDTFNAIAYRNNMAVSDLQELNPDVNINVLHIGQELNIREIVPRLSVTTTDQVTYTEPIASPWVDVEDDTMYVGTTKILTEGTDGVALITASIDYVNGKEVERTILNSETLEEPTPTTRAVGIKEKPKTASKGYYIWPCKGTITSYFGYRNIAIGSKYHAGIDIGAAYGTTIVAADGGKVTFAGLSGTLTSGYGYLVIITHDNGTKTYYGHCSKLLVSVGQSVYQGQAIAKVGSTGTSTGNHCHFEIRIGGTAVNPLNYLKR